MRVVAVIILLLVGCGEDKIGKQRQIQVGDGNEPFSALSLRAGWSFEYEATLTRAIGAVSSAQAAYRLSLTIEDVDDRGREGDSTVSFTGVGENTFLQNWDLTSGAGSWVARSGPADRDDRVSMETRVQDLDEGPQRPAALPSPKMLPTDRNFFIDFRFADEIRNRTGARFADFVVETITPEQHPEGRWRIAIRGEDPTLVYYDNKTRALELEYDTRGFLVLLRESIGDRADPTTANGDFVLRLKAAETP